jgi:hypothetical protein
MKTKMPNAAPNAAEVWEQIEDILVPQLRLSVLDHSVYSHLLRHSRLEGKLRLRFSIQWLARAVADQALGSFGEETLLDGGFDEFCFMRRSAGHVYGERKTMTVADRHDLAAFTAASRPDSRAPFFAELKLASMKDSLRSNFPRSRKSSASLWSSRVSNPERCHCWKRR